MLKLRNIVATIGLVSSLSLFSQTSDNGFYLLKMGQLKAAKAVFTQKISQNSLDSRSHYGMGEYYLANNNIDSANANFNRGIVINKNDAYNYLGLAKLAFLKGDNVVATAKLDLARKNGKKDAVVFTEIAQILRAQKNRDTTEINKAIARAKEINSKTSSIYILLAEIAAEKNNFSQAANNYESAIYFDSTEFEAYIQYARILVSAQNAKSAINYLNILINKTPQCVVAYRELGEVLFNQGDYKGSALNYAKYIERAEYTPEEKERYAYALFFSKEYDKAKAIITELSDGKPDNYIMLRLLAYTHFEKLANSENARPDDYQPGIELFNKFFSKIPENKILVLDYIYAAKTFQRANQDSLAVFQYQKAYNRDTTKTEFIDEMAAAYSKYKAYDKAVEMIQKSFDRKKEPKAADYMKLATAYAGAGTTSNLTDTVYKRNCLVKADTLLGTVTSMSPKYFRAYFMRARVNVALDTDATKGLAKPHYEKSLEIMNLTPEKYKKEMIETYKYLGYYYFQKNEITKSKDYWQMILAIDPTDPQAIAVMEGFKQKS